MTIPIEYARALEQFDRFVEELRVRLDHSTRHQTYQTIESVFRIFAAGFTAGHQVCRRLASGPASDLRRCLGFG